MVIPTRLRPVTVVAASTRESTALRRRIYRARILGTAETEVSLSGHAALERRGGDCGDVVDVHVDRLGGAASVFRVLVVGPGVAHHHDASLDGPFRMVHVVRIADLLADALGLSVLTPINPQSFEEVLNELPASARSHFHPDPEELKAKIDSRIQLWN